MSAVPSGRAAGAGRRPALTSADFSDADLYRFGLGVGARTLARAPVAAFKALAVPVEYVRCAESRYVLRQLDVRPGDRVLDVGSPKLTALFLAARLGAQVEATDLLGYFFERLGLYAEAALGPRRRLLGMTAQDARRLDYPARSFDRAYSISTIEHIPGDGDGEALAEIARVLKPGGLCCVTVPWGLDGYVEETKLPGDPDAYWTPDQTQPVFYQRAYDRPSLERRLLAEPRLELADLSFWGERRWPVENWILSRRLPRLLRYALLPAHFPLSRLFLSRLGEDERCYKKVACLTFRRRED